MPAKLFSNQLRCENRVKYDVCRYNQRSQSIVAPLLNRVYTGNQESIKDHKILNSIYQNFRA